MTLSPPSRYPTTSFMPHIGVIADQGQHDGVSAQAVMDKYLEAIVLAGGIPLILPQLLTDHPALFTAAMNRLDGLFLTGSYSNVAPYHYNDTDPRPEHHLDLGRDALAFRLIDYAQANNMPLLGICRGFQELVVHTGGTLYRYVHEQDAFHDHRENEQLSIGNQYAAVHDITLAPGGLLSQLLPDTPRLHVNSLHWQGARTLGEKVTVEAYADDGLVEAISVPGHRFMLGVQWHPEWQSRTAPASRRLFDTFLQHAGEYHHQNKQSSLPT